MKSFLSLSLHLLITSFLFAQAPLATPYQAVLRNADGSVMANAAANMIFMIHDGTAMGNLVYQESQSVTSNAQGLVSCVVGNGVVSQGNFADINWGNGAKFLHVIMGTTDLGTQQLMSVPFALYTNGVRLKTSATGDTLTIGGNSVIVPGISAANASSNGGLGAQVLPGNTTCTNEYISVTGCGGQSSLTYDGRTYDLVEIGGQCWFADNLATDQYRNGDLIPTGLDNTAWQNTTTGAYAIYNNDPANDVTYGKLYNWYTTVDTRGLCPTGWHVPSDCEWMYLEGSLGMSNAQQQIIGWRGSIASSLKSQTYWTNGNNSSGFNALPSGLKHSDGNFNYLGNGEHWWSVSEFSSTYSWFRNVYYGSSGMNRDKSGYSKNTGMGIRCVKD